jgi:hypothetical protein
MTPEPAAPSIPDWQLERYRLGELPGALAEAVGAALASDQALRLRAAELERHDAELFARHPPHRVAAEVRGRLAIRPAAVRTRLLLRPLPALAGAALLLLLLAPSLSRSPEPPALVGVKGLRPHLLLFRRAPTAEIERLPPGAAARAHDLVQLAYQGAGRRYGVIVSIDGRGLVTRHLPPRGPAAAALKPGAVALSQAYELDDAPACERFYLVAADAPFAVGEVVEAVRLRHLRPGPAEGEPAPLELPPSMAQHTFVLRKEPSR